MTTIAVRQHRIASSTKDDNMGREIPAIPHSLTTTTIELYNSRHENLRYLEASFYPEQAHLLDLTTVDAQSRLLALALTKLRPAGNDYAITRYEDAFVWSDVMASLRKLVVQEGIRWLSQGFYIVEFRSKLKTNIDGPLLYKLDKESHREATASGGLLKYWYGSPDKDQRNLATCVWRSKEDAINGGKGPWHRQARAATVTMYEEITVRGLLLKIADGVKEWSFEPFR